MNRLKLIFVSLLLICLGANYANAQSLQDILGKLQGVAAGSSQSSSDDSNSGSGLGNTLTNLVEGVFSSSNISVADMEGTWTSSGPAVCFQGDNFLKKAGGAAASAAIESKLDSYYKQFGLTGAVLTIDNEGNFELAVKKITLKGTISQNSSEGQGIFNFHFTAFGKMNLGSVKTYVQKTSNSMDVMFDATKLISIISTVANITNMSTLKTVSSLLNSYDGLCVGFKFTGASTNKNSGGLLDNLFNKGNKTETGTETESTESNSGNNSQEGINNAANALKNLFGK